MSPRASVVIPAHQRPDLMQVAIRSALDQTFSDTEVIVVDDGSQPSLEPMVETFADPRLRYLRLDRNVGEGGTRQAGLDLVTSEHVLFLDDDDVLRPEALRLLVDALEATPDAVFACGTRVLFDRRGQTLRYPWPRRRLRRGVRDGLLAGFHIVPSQTMFRSELLRKLGGWRTDIVPAGCDRELLLRHTKHGRPILIPQIVVDYRIHHRQHSNTTTLSTDRPYLREFTESLPSAENKRAVACLAAWHHRIEAETRFQSGDHIASLRLSLKAAASAPFLLLSSLSARQLVWSIVRAATALVLGPRVAPGMTRLKARLRVALNRDPGGDRRL